MHAALLPLTTALFALPFILFSMAGGFLADHFSKRIVTIWVKMWEVLIMVFATAGLRPPEPAYGLGGDFLHGRA